MQYVTRTCWRCEQEKPEGAFHQNRPGALKRVCAECRNAEKREKRAVQSAAHHAVERALERGELVRPAGCVECGVVGATDAHHDDYSKPLDVRWLCRSCHSRHHNARSNPSRRKVDVRLPAVLLESVDRAAEELGQTRTKFLERALEKALGDSVASNDGGASPSAPSRPSAGAAIRVLAEADALPVRSWRQHAVTCSCGVCKPPKGTE